LTTTEKTRSQPAGFLLRGDTRPAPIAPCRPRANRRCACKKLCFSRLPDPILADFDKAKNKKRRFCFLVFILFLICPHKPRELIGRCQLI
jgi:hypothetical protein